MTTTDPPSETARRIGRPPLTEQGFWAQVVITSRIYDGTPCIEWTKRTDRHGYGKVGRSGLAHRWSYTWANGPDSIPERTELDHRCRNRACVSPAHLEPVTHRENVLRGISVSALAAAKTHCPQGHPYSPANTYVRPNGHRKCRTCKREGDRRRAARQREGVAA